jgi:hypothetical protein
MQFVTMRSMTRILFGSLLAASTFSATSGAAQVDLDEIRRCYIASNAALLKGIEVEWKQTFEVLLPQALAEIGSWPLNHDGRAVAKGEKRLYEVRHSPAPGHEMPEDMKRRAVCYDGISTWKLISPHNVLVDAGNDLLHADLMEFFLARQGHPMEPDFKIWVLKDLRQVRPVGFSCDLIALVGNGKYSVHDSVQFAGRECVVLSSAQDRLFLDPSRGYAIVGRELSPEAGAVGLRYECRDFFEARPNVWLAKEIVTDSLVEGHAAVRVRYAMQRIRFDVTDDEFKLDLDPGTNVADTRYSKPKPEGLPVVGYRVPAGPVDLEALARAAAERSKLSELRAERGSAVRRVVVVVNIVVVLAAVLLILRRLRRPRQAPPFA